MIQSPTSIHSFEDLELWLREVRRSANASVNIIELESLKSWSFNGPDNSLAHISGRYFTIEGVWVKTNVGPKHEWFQPIINQREIGILGFLGTFVNGVLHLLVQAKIEPGNIGVAQISPTLQATKSNFERAHQGREPKFLNIFRNADNRNILVDQLQSEQGARFMHKRNRNMVVLCEKPEEVREGDDYRWMSIDQIRRFLNFPNTVNMDARSILASLAGTSPSRKDDCLHHGNHLFGLPGRSYMSSVATANKPEQYLKQSSLYSDVELLSWIASLKFSHYLTTQPIALNKLKDWRFHGGRLVHKDDKYFSIIGVRAEINGREVESWDQPMIKPSQEGIIGFLIKRINGQKHFLVQAKVEVGNFDTVELAPTVQCLTGNYRTSQSEYKVPFIEYFINCHSDCSVYYDTMQSEEGGRFYREENRNVIVELHDSIKIDTGTMHRWMTLNQLVDFGRYSNMLNMSCRSLLAAIGPEWNL